MFITVKFPKSLKALVDSAKLVFSQKVQRENLNLVVLPVHSAFNPYKQVLIQVTSTYTGNSVVVYISTTVITAISTLVEGLIQIAIELELLRLKFTSYYYSSEFSTSLRPINRVLKEQIKKSATFYYLVGLLGGFTLLGVVGVLYLLFERYYRPNLNLILLSCQEEIDSFNSSENEMEEEVVFKKNEFSAGPQPVQAEIQLQDTPSFVPQSTTTTTTTTTISTIDISTSEVDQISLESAVVLFSVERDLSNVTKVEEESEEEKVERIMGEIILELEEEDMSMEVDSDGRIEEELNVLVLEMTKLEESRRLVDSILSNTISTTVDESFVDNSTTQAHQSHTVPTTSQSSNFLAIEGVVITDQDGDVAMKMEEPLEVISSQISDVEMIDDLKYVLPSSSFLPEVSIEAVEVALSGIRLEDVNQVEVQVQVQVQAEVQVQEPQAYLLEQQREQQQLQIQNEEPQAALEVVLFQSNVASFDSSPTQILLDRDTHSEEISAETLVKEEIFNSSTLYSTIPSPTTFDLSSVTQFEEIQSLMESVVVDAERVSAEEVVKVLAVDLVESVCTNSEEVVDLGLVTTRVVVDSELIGEEIEATAEATKKTKSKKKNRGKKSVETSLPSTSNSSTNTTTTSSTSSTELFDESLTMVPFVGKSSPLSDSLPAQTEQEQEPQLQLQQQQQQEQEHQVLAIEATSTSTVSRPSSLNSPVEKISTPRPKPAYLKNVRSLDDLIKMMKKEKEAPVSKRATVPLTLSQIIKSKRLEDDVKKVTSKTPRSAKSLTSLTKSILSKSRPSHFKKSAVATKKSQIIEVVVPQPQPQAQAEVQPQAEAQPQPSIQFGPISAREHRLNENNRRKEERRRELEVKKVEVLVVEEVVEPVVPQPLVVNISVPVVDIPAAVVVAVEVEVAQVAIDFVEELPARIEFAAVAVAVESPRTQRLNARNKRKEEALGNSGVGRDFKRQRVSD